MLDATDEDDYGSLELHADLAGDSRPETALASYRLGVAVVDPAGRLVDYQCKLADIGPLVVQLVASG